MERPRCLEAPIREDLEASHGAITLWVDIFERLYHVLRLRPHPSTIVRGLRKMPKLYLWGWRFIPEPGPRLESVTPAH